jgi:predicted GH43/DUF377 family glycosyl hydrolase
MSGTAIDHGAADTSVALATGSIRELLGWLDENSKPISIVG